MPDVEDVRVRERDPLDVARPGGDESQHHGTAHRLPEHNDRSAPRTQRVETPAGFVHPFGPAPGAEVVDARAVAGEAYALDGEPSSCVPCPDRSHRRRRTREAVHLEYADRALAE